ncbi:hypothetical protein AXK11_05530 [Cephaloticoccus primus]|uniref:DUF3817 domain-containing protein n=1 Tax=Cephaloticoccus primus TaxID=1548207 RepID=A0A139SML5_9BACT|nr:hypothetical protein AXK11_05530 [Cephaloticoccus primus]
MRLVRLVTLVEATSFLLLLAVAMPLKYLAGLPQAVRIVGMLHGVLFLLLCWALLQAVLDERLSAKRALATFAITFVPVAPFFFDKRLKQWEQE